MVSTSGRRACIIGFQNCRSTPRAIDPTNHACALTCSKHCGFLIAPTPVYVNCTWDSIIPHRVCNARAKNNQDFILYLFIFLSSSSVDVVRIATSNSVPLNYVGIFIYSPEAVIYQSFWQKFCDKLSCEDIESVNYISFNHENNGIISSHYDKQTKMRVGIFVVSNLFTRSFHLSLYWQNFE